MLLNNAIVHPEFVVKLQGVQIESRLSLTNHITYICKKAGKTNKRLSKILSYDCIQSSLKLLDRSTECSKHSFCHILTLVL